MTEVIFIIEEFDKNGKIITLADKFYKNFPDMNYDQWFYWINDSYYKNTGKRIKYQTYSSIENFNPNIKYFYFIPLALWGNDFHNYVMLFDLDKQRRLVKNNVKLLFSLDHEHIPSFDVNFFIKSFEWLDIMLWSNNCSFDFQFYFLSAAKLAPKLIEYMELINKKF